MRIDYTKHDSRKLKHMLDIKRNTASNPRVNFGTRVQVATQAEHIENVLARRRTVTTLERKLTLTIGRMRRARIAIQIAAMRRTCYSTGD